MPRPPRKKITALPHHPTNNSTLQTADVAPTPLQRRNEMTNVAPTPASVLSLANFKRRPRQPSILHMVQQARAAESEGEESAAYARGGLTSRRVSRGRGEGNVEEDDVSYLTLPRSSSPEREVSPPRALRERREEQTQARGRPQIQELTSCARSRKRKRGSDGDKENISPVPTSKRAPRDKSPSPTPISSPLSSSPTSDHLNDTRLTSKKLRTPNLKPKSKPSKSTTTAPKPKPQPAPKATPITTAHLQTLMPQRRPKRQLRRRNDEFEILDTSSSPSRNSDIAGPEEDEEVCRDDDDDELELPARKGKFLDKLRKSTVRPLGGGGGAAKSGRPPKAAKGGPLAAKTTAQTAKTPAKSFSAAAKAPNKTYTRLSSSDKENWTPGAEPSTEDSTLLSPETGRGRGRAASTANKGKEKASGGAAATHGAIATRRVGVTSGVGATGGEEPVEGQDEELAAARKKFADVDNWDLSFESADIGGGGSSSPWR